MNDARVSVLVPTFNRSRYLGECLDSLLAQTRPPLEVIVIDDGSTDDSAQIVREYGARIRYVHKENGGKSSALNLGMRDVAGDFVWIFDDDDVALADSIARRMDVFTAHPELAFVYTGHYWGKNGVDGRIERGSRHHVPECRDGQLLARLLKGCFFTQPSVLARTACYRELGPFDETLARSQDYDMLIRLAHRYSGMGIDEPSLIVRRHEGARGPETSRHSHFERERVWMKFDQAIGRGIRDSFALAEYLPAPVPVPAAAVTGAAAEPAPVAAERLALLHRMQVMASKGLIGEMLDDLEQATRVAADVPLSAEERQLCREAICDSYCQLAMVDSRSLFFGRVRDLAATESGRDMVSAFARGMFWLARTDQSGAGDRLRRLAVSLKLLLLSRRSAEARTLP